MSVSKSDHYDVVVVGTGAAGTSAALEASQKGAKVLLLEKGRTTGGSSNYTEGLFALILISKRSRGSKFPVRMFWKKKLNIRSLKLIQEFGGTTLMTVRVRFNGWKIRALNTKVYKQWVPVKLLGIFTKAWVLLFYTTPYCQKPKKNGVKILTLTKATQLHTTADGAISGVTIRSAKTKETQEISTSAVILATGGYLNNAKMMDELTPYDTSRLIPVSSGKGTGDGVRMGWQTGAKHYGTGMAMLFGGYLKDPDEPSFKMMPSQMNAAAGQQPLLWINENGERFVDESVAYNFSYAGNAMYTQNQVYSVLDQGVIDRMIKDGNFMGLGVYVKRGEKMTKLQDEIDAALAAKKPFIFKADTIEDLAKQMGVPVETFRQTVETYNGYCDSGDDKEFGKNSDYLVGVEHGPYYGFKLNIGAFCTMGGMQVTTNNEVMNEKGTAIKGLYAAGNDAAGLTGDTYGPNMPGTCVGYAYYSGRNSGKHAAEYAQA